MPELDSDPRDASPAQSAPAELIPPAPREKITVREHKSPADPEVLPPAHADVTSTALKRAMRRRAQEYADEALDTLVEIMRDRKNALPVTRASAAEKILDRAHGKVTTDIEIGEGVGGLQIAIIKFGDGNG